MHIPILKNFELRNRLPRILLFVKSYAASLKGISLLLSQLYCRYFYVRQSPQLMQ